MNSFRPHFPRRLLARPELVQILIFAVRINGKEKSVMAIGHELTFARQALQRLTFEDALGPTEVIEHAAVEDEEAGADQAISLGLLHEALNLPLGVGFEHSEARDGWDGRNSREPAVLAMKVEQAADVHVAQAVAVCKQEGVVVFEITGNALQAATGLGFEAGVGESDGEILFVVSAHELDLRLAAKANSEVTIHGFVVQEVILDHVAAVSEAEDKLAHSVVGVHLHDVPQNGSAPDLHHRFGPEFGFFPETGT